VQTPLKVSIYFQPGSEKPHPRCDCHLLTTSVEKNWTNSTCSEVSLQIGKIYLFCSAQFFPGMAGFDPSISGWLDKPFLLLKLIKIMLSIYTIRSNGTIV
jgi:hypothetical protein